MDVSPFSLSLSLSPVSSLKASVRPVPGARDAKQAGAIALALAQLPMDFNLRDIY